MIRDAVKGFIKEILKEEFQEIHQKLDDTKDSMLTKHDLKEVIGEIVEQLSKK